MTPFTGRAIGLGFAALWWLLGAAALPPPYRWIMGAVGLSAIAALAIRAWGIDDARTGLFRRGRYWVAVALEIGALAAANALLHRYGLDRYLLPVVAIIVGLHFIGLWWAGGDIRYLQLAGALTAVGMVALLIPGGQMMQAFTGFGSGLALAWAAGSRAPR